MKIINTCDDCGKVLKSRNSKRCPSCSSSGKNNANYGKGLFGKNNPNYNEGVSILPSYCIDCNKEVSWYQTKRCYECYRINCSNISTGKGNPNYKDGSTPLYSSIRVLSEYKDWRLKVYKKDYYTCQMCNKKGLKLHAHHIKHFKDIFNDFINKYNRFSVIDDRETLLKLAMDYKPFWEISNGKTLCKDCHKVEHSSKEINYGK